MRPLLLALGLLVAPLAAAQPAAPGADPADVAARLDALLGAYHDAGGFDGVVLVAEGDRVVYRAAFGEADRAWGIATTPETRFPVASVTKQLVAVVALQLVQEGRLDLDAPVGRYAPGLFAAADAVTVRHLLQHTSGLADLDAGESPYLACRFDPLAPSPYDTPEGVLAAVAEAPPATSPGTAFRYTNTDYLALQVVLERATGRPVADLLAERLFRPLGMDATAPATVGGVAPRLARSYVAGADGQAREAGCVERAAYGAAAFLLSSADDLLRFDRALLDGRLLTPDARATLWASSPALGYAALGAWTYTKALPDGRAVRVVERQGETGAFHLLNVLLPDDDRVVIAFKNAGTASLNGLAWQPGLADDLVRVVYGLAPTGPGTDG